MKYFLLSILLIASYALYANNGDDDSNLPLDSVVMIINRSLQQASQELSETKLAIEKASVTLKTEYDKSGEGGFKLFVKANQKWQIEESSSMTYVFENVKNTKNKSASSKQEQKFEEHLTKAIVSAAKQWASLSNSIKGLSKSNFSVDISFVVKKTTNAGIEFEVCGVGLDAGGEFEKAVVHTVSLTFK